MDLASHSETLERAAASIRVHPDDNVAVALKGLRQGEIIEVGGMKLALIDAIEPGHKFALLDLAKGEAVRKFGWPIVRTRAAIAAGAHVHTHNAETLLGGIEGYSYDRRQAANPLPSAKDARFLGYKRSDGRVGTRNEIWILPTVGCVARTAERIAAAAAERHSGAVDGVHAFQHPFGCSQLGDDLAGTRSLLASLACNPNAGGVLIIGLGCESNQLDALLAEIPQSQVANVRTLRAQAEGDEVESGLALVDSLVAEAALTKRQSVPLSELVVGLKCGGSDGLSGLTANPLVGRIADLVVGSGGSAALSEIPELFGADPED